MERISKPKINSESNPLSARSFDYGRKASAVQRHADSEDGDDVPALMKLSLDMSKIGVDCPLEPTAATPPSVQTQAEGEETQKSETNELIAQRTPLKPRLGSLLDLPLMRPPVQPPVQAKLTIGKPNDRYEQEADAMAAQVMTMPEPTVGKIQRNPEESGEAVAEEAVQTKLLAAVITPLVQRQEYRAPTPSAGLESQLQSSKGGGSSLGDDTRSFMESRFGADFSEVRVHTDASAVQMNKDLSAHACAHGSDIYYGAGKSPGQNELTAHELTHVVQQTGALNHKLADMDNLPPTPLLNDRSNSENKEYPFDNRQAQADAKQNAQQVNQSSKREFRRSVELAPQPSQAGVNHVLDLVQADSNSLANAEKDAKPEDIFLSKTDLNGKSENQSETQVDEDYNGSPDSPIKVPACNKSSEESKVSAASFNFEDEVTKGALDKTNVQTEQAKSLRQKANTTLTNTQNQVAQLTSVPVRFAAPKQNSNRFGAVAKLEQRQTIAAAHTSELVTYGGARLQDLLELGQTTLTDVQPAVINAQASVEQSLVQNRTAIATQISDMRSQVSHQAKFTQAQIIQKHQTTLPAIQTATTDARQRIEAAHTVALATLSASEQAQSERIHQLYGQGEKDFRETGPKAGNEALVVGHRRQQTYLSQRDGESDLLDGPLHDNRLEAKADAAIKVAEAYRAKLIETANEQAAKSREGQPKDREHFILLGRIIH
jgi:Domain of unknown function (DUF4157)